MTIIPKSDGFESPVDFNDSQTITKSVAVCFRFESPVDFNDSQTAIMIVSFSSSFESPVDFNDSQTASIKMVCR